MRRALLASLVVVPLLVASAALAYTSPGSPTGYVNDFAGVLSSQTKIDLEQELAAFEASTSNEVAVVTVKSLGGDYIENYAVKLFEEYKIGKAKEDNGVLLLLAIDDHKLRIEVGYGLEGALPDSVADNIISDEMTPLLKAGDYDGAVAAGVHAIEAATVGEYVGSGNDSSGGWDFMDYMWAFIFFPIIIFQWLGAILARSKSWWAGGIVGGGVGLLVSTIFGWWLLAGLGATVGLFLIGLLFDLAVSSAYHAATSKGVQPPWWGGGTMGGGSGSSSGGFGGFGGGSSGGGGASGSW